MPDVLERQLRRGAADAGGPEAQAPLTGSATEAPAREFCGLKIYAAREGTRVRGRVVFPHQVGADLDDLQRALREGRRVAGRQEVPIDYHRPEPRAAAPAALVAVGDQAVPWKVALVLRLKASYVERPALKHRQHQVAVHEWGRAQGHRFSLRSLQLWEEAYDKWGPEGLDHAQVRACCRTAEASAQHYADAVLLCCWWAFRIGNFRVVNTDLVRQSVLTLLDGYAIADLIATIDFYYAWPSDRRKYPFVPLHRFLRREHLDMWMLRAAESAERVRQWNAERQERVSLKRMHAALPPTDEAIPGRDTAKARARATRNHRVRRGMQDLAAEGAGNREPGTEGATALEQWLVDLDDPLRTALVQASHGDRKAFDHALHTLPLWWDSVPDELRSAIDNRQSAIGNSDSARRVSAVLQLLPAAITQLDVARRLS